jgi:hypothetical protein
MATKLYAKMKAADAIKALGAALSGVKVQTAREVLVEGEDGKKRPTMQAELVAFKPEHVLSAKKWANGQVTIVTIDGQRFPKNANTRVEADDDEEVAA